MCKECGGAGICEHSRQRYQCKDCGGAGICKHGKRRSKCRECGGKDCGPGLKRKKKVAAAVVARPDVLSVLAEACTATLLASVAVPAELGGDVKLLHGTLVDERDGTDGAGDGASLFATLSAAASPAAAVATTAFSAAIDEAPTDQPARAQSGTRFVKQRRL